MSMPRYPADEAVETTGYSMPRQWWPGYLLAGLLLVIAALGGVIFGGQVGQFMLAGMEVLPFAVLAFFAYLGVRQIWARVVAFLWLGVVLLGLAGVSMLLILSTRLVALGAVGGAADPSKLVAAITSPEFRAAVVWMLVGIVVAGLLLVPRVRRDAARLLTIDPRSSVHAIALSVVGGATVMSFGQLIASRGMPALLDMVKVVPDRAAGSSDAAQLLLIVYGFAWQVPGALVAAGFPIVRTLGAALQRLGLVVPTWRQVLAAIGLALLMVAGSMLLDKGIGQLWTAMGWPRTDNAAFEKLLGAAVSIPGAVLIGITAGLGEEMVVRGVLQPRLGILLSNLFFASLHAFQYGFDALLSVFVVGLILGIVRARSNTTTSSIVHGTYDFVLVLFSALHLFQ